jgi:hypothetical protein
MHRKIVEATPSTRKGLNVDGLGGEDYLKCMVCGKKMRVVHSNHLERHGLTVDQYLSMFPGAKVYSGSYIESVKRNFWTGVGRVRVRRCIRCGLTFTTRSPNKVRCNLCQRIHRLESLRLRERLRRRFGKAQRQILGTKGGATDLKVLGNGRVAAALWLERNRGGRTFGRMLDGDGQLHCQTCESTCLMLVMDGQAYCTECGGKIVVARRNEYYTATELCCGECGLVYDTLNLKQPEPSPSPFSPEPAEKLKFPIGTGLTATMKGGWENAC